MNCGSREPRRSELTPCATHEPDAAPRRAASRADAAPAFRLRPPTALRGTCQNLQRPTRRRAAGRSRFRHRCCSARPAAICATCRTARRRRRRWRRSSSAQASNTVFGASTVKSGNVRRASRSHRRWLARDAWKRSLRPVDPTPAKPTSRQLRSRSEEAAAAERKRLETALLQAQRVADDARRDRRDIHEITAAAVAEAEAAAAVREKSLQEHLARLEGELVAAQDRATNLQDELSMHAARTEEEREKEAAARRAEVERAHALELELKEAKRAAEAAAVREKSLQEAARCARTRRRGYDARRGVGASSAQRAGRTRTRRATRRRPRGGGGRPRAPRRPRVGARARGAPLGDARGARGEGGGRGEGEARAGARATLAQA